MSMLRRLITMIVGSVAGVLRGKSSPKSKELQRIVMNHETNISTIMDHAMSMQSREEALAFFEVIVDWALKNWNVPGRDCDRPNAIYITKKNLRYWCGKCQHNAEAWGFIHE